MVIKNESPHMTGGEHEVVDDVHRHGKHDAEITGFVFTIKQQML